MPAFNSSQMPFSHFDNFARRPCQVSLPSIQELFPEHMARGSPYLNTGTGCASDGNRHGYKVSEPPSPLQSTHPRGQATLEVEHPYNRRRYSFRSASPIPRTTNHEGYSFDILRPDPSTSSLEHIHHSNTFRNRGCIVSPQGTSMGMSNGSAPVFKVSPPSLHVTVPPHTHQEVQAANAPLGRSSSASSRGANNVLAGFSSVISFPPSNLGINGSPELRRGNLIDSVDVYPYEKGKKHKCHICSKRFNRPSSLRIHVNTHTGATPFRCPYPTCGREFNVNSNMRRHYRNHLASLCQLRRSSEDPRQHLRRSPLSTQHAGLPCIQDLVSAETRTAMMSEDLGEHNVECGKSDTNPWIRHPQFNGDQEDDDTDSSDSLSSSSSPRTPLTISPYPPHRTGYCPG
jgi:uncharacterized Zn-finger protein